ncbi:MAG: beta-ketoacyl-[acyl-carrier-protein] synthase II, partial [Candidatus Eremiobacteraeota bacterium]|nr:beta-ketoacyl-[acyl-carrier-protein] synthase II [Candidatus Eremiobacteraeota bacterium]
MQENHQLPRVVVTGMGVISALGVGLDKFWDGLRAGQSGIRKIESFDTSAFTTQ